MSKTERRPMAVTLYTGEITGPEADAVASLVTSIANAIADVTGQRTRAVFAPPSAPPEVQRVATYVAEPRETGPCDCPFCTLGHATTERAPEGPASEPEPPSMPVESRINARGATRGLVS